MAPQLDSFVAPIFEEICRQFPWRLGLVGGLPFLSLRIGGWWQSNEEIDVVVVGQGAAPLVECKWTGKSVGMDVLRDLERKARLAGREMDSRQLFYGLCARSGFTPQVEEEAAQRKDLLLFDLRHIVKGV